NVTLPDELLGLALDLIEQNEQATAVARELARRPRGRHPITYSADGFSTLLRHLDDMTILQDYVLLPSFLVRVEQGDLPGALQDVVAQLNLGRSLADEPVVVSQLVRAGRHQRNAVRWLERVLGHGRPDAAALAAVQA